jgi:hypothetical protein
MIKAIIIAIMILIADFFTIMNMTLGATDLTNFRCDIERIDTKTYKADVHVTINFTFNRQDAANVFAIMGDGNVVWDISGTEFSFNYSIEGIYNVTLWAQIPGLDSEWLIIEVVNDAPNFEIGIAPIEYYPATYDFEDDELSGIPHDWEIYDNDIPLYLIHTELYNGQTVSGSYQDLKYLDGNKWIIRTNNIWPYSDIEIGTSFMSLLYYLSPGKFELYFQANRSMILRENMGHGDFRKVFEGDSSFGKIITLDTPYLELVTSLEDIFQSIEIDWLMLVAIDNGVEVTKDVNDHGKIAQISLLNSSILCGIRQNFPSQLYGTIELWYKTSETMLGGRISSQSDFIDLIQKNNSWYLGSTNITAEIGAKPLEHTWYHIRIDWRDSGSPPYESLNSGYYRIYIDGNPSNQYSLSSGGSGISSLNIETKTTIFIDAVGYTWESYTIGNNKFSIYPQNIYEDQEITFSVIDLKESKIDKKGFSYNSESPIIGNYSYLWDFANGNYSNDESPTFRFSKAGDYPVRLTLIDDQGAMTTKVRLISIKNKQPETSIWNGINFDATYDFKHDLSGNPPSGWTTAGNVEVVNFKDKFSKVIEIDTTAGGFGSMNIKEQLWSLHDSIEFWVYFSDVNEDKFYFRAGSQFASNPKEEIRFGFFDGVWKYYYTWEDPVFGTQYDYAAISELDGPQSEEWIHVRFQLDDYNNQWRIFINDIPSEYYDSVGNFNIWNIGLFVESGSHIFLDSFGFASDPNYNIGDNNPPQIDTYYASWDFRFYPNGPILFDNDKKLSTLGPWAFTSYGFEEIADGCSANIIAELDDHYKVLELQDNNESDVIVASLLDLAKPTYGTIEFWLRTSDVSQGLLMTFGYEVFRSGISINSDGGWSYINNNQEIDIDDVPQLEDDKWHHIRIDFDSRENGGYLGLGANQFYFWVDSRFSRLGPFNFDDLVSNLKWNIWSSKEEGKDYSIYLDAIGVSWDPSYEIGENLVPREPLYSETEIIFNADSFDTASDKKNLQYFWNFGDNQSAFGETILHRYGRPGKYKVQLVAIDDNGLYDIDEKYVWIDNIDPTTEIFKISSGISDDFTNDIVGEFPSGWFPSPMEDPYGKITQVVNQVDGYDKPVQIGMGPVVGGIWLSNGTGAPLSMAPGSLNEIYGTIEFWLYTNDTSQSSFGFQLYENQFNDGINFIWNSTHWIQANYSGGFKNPIIMFSDSWKLKSNTWTHFRIDFSCDDSYYMGLENGTYKIYADGYSSQVLPIRTNIGYFGEIESITDFGVWTINPSASEFQGAIYVDNFGFSWDPFYDVGGNLNLDRIVQFNEGETIILDCMSYDTYLDYQQLSYFWGDARTNIEDWTEMGWIHSYFFPDDTFGEDNEIYTINSYVRDSLNSWDFDSYNMKIVNVLPSFSVSSANVLTNITAGIYNQGIEGANFSVYIKANNDTLSTINVNYPTNYPESRIFSNKTEIWMDISKNWTIVINQTAREGGDHLFVLTMEFGNGHTINETYLFDGMSDVWLFEVNSFWINTVDHLSSVPIMFEASVSDPSNDLIDLSVDYVIESIYEVNYPSSSLQRYYTIQNEPNDIVCMLSITEDNGKKYATVEFREEIQNDWNELLLSGFYPVCYFLNFTVDMTDIDIYGFISNIFQNIGSISIIEHLATTHKIDSKYQDLGSISQLQTKILNFNITSKFEFENLAPSIRMDAPKNITEDQTYEYLAFVEDPYNENISVSFTFGINNGTGLVKYNGISLGNHKYGFNHSYSNAGKYLITVIADNGIAESKFIHQIEVINIVPYAKIKVYQSSAFEDQYLRFEADLFDTESDIDTLRYYWDFGDGICVSESKVIHKYINAGNYTVRFIVRDDNGGTFYASEDVMINEQSPQIYGPLSFKGVEGQIITLDVDMSDSFSESIMNYTWDIYKAHRIYNGTYSFMNYGEGELPVFPFIDYATADDINYMVIDELAGHNKVLVIEDNNNQSSGSWSLNYGDSGSKNGSIEFWLRASYIAPKEENFMIQLLEYGTTLVPLILSENGSWMFKNIFTGNKSIISNVPRIISNTWHHIRIDYECTTGNYLGLDEDHWRIIVDGISSPDLNMQFDIPPNDDAISLDTLKITTKDTGNISLYCDAIGFHNGSTAYNIGDNYVPILFSHNYINTIYGADPSVALNDGNYLIELTAENTELSKAELNIDVTNIAPIISTSSKRYSGSPGYIEINAHAYDSIIDYDLLEFEWFIGSDRIHTESGSLKSKVKILCDYTGTIKGHVSVSDSSDYSATIDFVIMVFIDSNGNGLSNEYEVLSGIYGVDFDGDNLPSIYETDIYGTLPGLWDTDNDGLCDGWDNATQSGEYGYTNATNPDTDGDRLLDGFEFFGWNVSIYDGGETKLYRYTSNPLEPDSDYDGIYDYYEYLNGTNPFESDSDNDLLTDFEEIHIFKTDPTDPDCDDDGLLDGIEFEIGTHYDNSDTDGDGIIDGEEYLGWDNFHTDPLCKDSDHDFLTDSSEIINYNFQIDSRKSVENGVILKFEQDGIDKAVSSSLFYLLSYSETALNESISDIRVVIFKADTELIIVDKIYEMDGTTRYVSNVTDIKTIIERAGESYSGDYILRVNYLEQDHANMMLEDYSIELSRYLDPSDDDFDKDGILDGVESSLLVEGVNIEQNNEAINLTVDTNSTTTDYYQLEISDIGTIENANFSFTVFSNNTLLGDGSVSVTVVKRELDIRKADGTIFSSIISFSSEGVILNEYFVDLRSYFPYNYYGFYDIIIDVYDNNNSDSFFLTNITIFTDGYLEASFSDSQAWITKPDISDTDGDGWSDGYEIYNRAEMTNPLAWDTDGDGIKDSVDIDPLYNIVLQVNFVKGQIHDLETWYVERRNPPLLQMTVEFDQKGEKTSWTSTHTPCSEDKKTAISTFLGIEMGRIDYYSTAVFGHSYVIDIEDDIQNYLLTFKLWDEFIGDIDQYGDNLLLTKNYWHNLQTSGVNNPVEVYGTQGDNWLRATVTTRRLNHTNTIAIYDNSSQFNGHYNQYNRMNILQIYVNDLPDISSPFENGINYILVPNELFINTELNYIIQNDLENSLLASGEFLSVDRDNVPESSSKHIDSIFKIECSYLEAEEILNLTLNIIINFTTGEIAPRNFYASSKLNQSRIELMNVQQDILDLVPYYCPYSNSEQGSVPIERADRVWWADPLEDFVKNIAGIIFGPLIALGLLFLAFLDFVWDIFVIVVVLLVLVYLTAVILIVKTVVLGTAYAFFALVMLNVLKEFAILTAFVFLICVPRGLDLTLTPNSLTVQGQITFSYTYEIDFWYLPFFDFYFPSVKETYTFGGVNFIRDRNFITVLTDPIFNPDNTIEDALLSCELDPNLPDGDSTDFYQGIADSMNLFGVFMSTAATTLIVGEVSNKFLARITAFVQLFGLGVILSRLIFDATSSNLLSKQYLRGIFIGGKIVSALNNLIAIKGAEIKGKWQKLKKISKFFKTLFASYELADPSLNNLFNIDILGVFTTGRLFSGVFPDTVDFQFLLKSFDVVRGFLTLGLGAFVMSNIPNVKTKNDMAENFSKIASLFPLLIYLSFCIY